jgi:flagellar hook-associated protein 2
VTLNLVNTGSTPATITVSTSSSGASSALSQLVSDYNSLQSTIAQYTAKGAVLAGDATAEGIMSQINRALFTYDTSLPVGYQSIADAGVTLTLNSDKTTTLNFSASTFSSAYASNPAALQNLFTGATGTGGIAGNLSTQLKSLSAPSTGVIATILQGYQNEIQSLNQSEQAQQSLIQLQQSALANQFNQEINTLISLLGQQSTVNSLINAVTGQSSSSSSSSSSKG